ncbi:XRE family transcriptional regulator [Herbaspirillum sp. LeCh32-8]|uniref:helix-turn-helix domain-containing protein n=1 Tax=Herbaspirillum sp. LeCh32-8 TaxID=2821356 RepID=UPI001AE3932F|nr:XRE family transcriptional regulator [Herbaspirillum sp. LeCh32-8]MBP0600752.1 XRE family transcriptional regulator [Herbaspirillum sp. LeCh32-8]
MAIESKSRHMTHADGNVFADLGFGPKEAAELKVGSQRLIFLKLVVRDYLVTELAAWIEANNPKPSDAGRILGITCRRVADISNKNGSEFSIDSLVDMLLRAGKRVTVSVE